MKSAKNVTFEMIEALAKKGVKAGKAGEQLGIAYHQMVYILEQKNVRYRDIVEAKSPQNKAWDTRKKLDAIEAYKNAPTTGKKASINRKFKAKFGLDLKDLVAPKIEKVIVPKVAKIKTPKFVKETFSEKFLQIKMPYAFTQVVERLDKEIEGLKKELELLKKK